jgi:glycosyltransferase involved in cell wall biosynthesis
MQKVFGRFMPLNSKCERVFHVTDNHSPQHPGVSTVVTQLSRYLGDHGWATTILTAGPAHYPVSKRVELREFPIPPGGQIWRYPQSLADYLKEIRPISGSILHLHGVWMAPQWMAARIANKRNIPALLSTHNMLSPWLWQDGYLKAIKKKIYWHCLAYPAFRELPLIHAITPKEKEELKKYFSGQTIKVIPNAIDLKEADSYLSVSRDGKTLNNFSPYILFLGRLHPHKGIDILIQAFAQSVPGKDWRLVIVGPDSTPEYTVKLKTLVQKLGIKNQVIFKGQIFGPQKWHLYRKAWAFCAPSRTEVVGLVNLEAAAAKTPVVTTYETGLFDWEEGAGILIEPDTEKLSQALTGVFSWSEEERNERGQKLRQLVENRYSWEAVGQQWLNLYSGLLENYG